MYGQDDLFVVQFIGLVIVVVCACMLYQFASWSYTRIRLAIRRKYGYFIMRRAYRKVKYTYRKVKRRI